MDSAPQPKGSTPPLTTYLVTRRSFAGKPMRVVDAGVRGGPEQHWAVYADQGEIVWFEPNEPLRLRTRIAWLLRGLIEPRT